LCKITQLNVIHAMFIAIALRYHIKNTIFSTILKYVTKLIKKILSGVLF